MYKKLNRPFLDNFEVLMVYGYARCSTNEERQDIDRQKRELKKLGVANEKNMYWEYESGTKDDRAELLKLLDIIKTGDGKKYYKVRLM